MTVAVDADVVSSVFSSKPRPCDISLPFRVRNGIFAAGDWRAKRGPEDDVSAQRPEIGDHHSREMAAEMAFLLASYQLRVSEDWVVVAPGLEPGIR